MPSSTGAGAPPQVSTDRAGITKVSEARLGRALEELRDHAYASGVWAQGFEGYERRTLSRDLELDIFPGRGAVPVERADPTACRCALCRPPIGGRGLEWRDFRIVPNAFPYVRPGGTHLLVTSVRHAPQGFALESLGDLLDLQRAASATGPMTLHYNGLAGNSQHHWHWQLTDERLPLERALNERRLPLRRLRHGPKVEIASFDHGLMKGILVEGDQMAVRRWAGDIVRRLEEEPGALYNLLVLPRRGDKARVVVVPRRVAKGDGRAHFGAFPYAGRFVSPTAEVSPQVLREREHAALAEVIAPAELPWLASLAKAPEPPVVALRAGGPLVRHQLPGGATRLVDPHGEFVLPEKLSPGGVRLPTERVAGHALRFTLFGDSGKGDANQAKVARALTEFHEEQKVHFAIHTGDLVYPNGVSGVDDPDAARLVTRPYAGLGQVYLSLGNHDWATTKGFGDPDAWSEIAAETPGFTMPSRYYSKRWEVGAQSLEMFVLDTSVLASDDDQRQWLSENLRRSDADWKLVVGHHPLYSHGLHGGQAHMRALLLPELTQHSDLYAGGHEHDQQVLENDDGLMFLVTGTAGEGRATGVGTETNFATSALGFSAIELSPAGLRLDVLDAEGSVLHSELRSPRGRRARSSSLETARAG